MNNTHEVKFHIASIYIPQIDKLPPPPQFCCILHSIPILHSFDTDISDDYVPVLNMCDDLVSIFHMYEDFVSVFHMCEDLVLIILHVMN